MHFFAAIMCPFVVWHRKFSARLNRLSPFRFSELFQKKRFCTTTVNVNAACAELIIFPKCLAQEMLLFSLMNFAENDLCNRFWTCSVNRLTWCACLAVEWFCFEHLAVVRSLHLSLIPRLKTLL